MLLKLTVLEETPNGPSPTDITSDVAACSTGVKPGDVCWLADESPPAPTDGGVADASAPTDGALAKADPPLCLLNAADWCRCQQVDPDDTEKGAWNCAPFAPRSTVVATFDRLLDTTPFEADSGVAPENIVALTAMPAPPTAVSPLLDYSSTGSANFALIFNNFGPFYFANYRSFGPSILVGGAPALPSGATISIDLSKMNVRAKDGKTAFTGEGFLAAGALKFKTDVFSVSFAIPSGDELPPPVTPTETDGGADGGVADAGDAGSDAAVVISPPPSTGPVPADMNKGTVTLTFNNLVDEAALAHVTMTVDDAPFTGFTITSSVQEEQKDGTLKPVYPTTGLVISPKETWEAGKKYVVIVDANTADLTGVKLGEVQAQTFVMQAN